MIRLRRKKKKNQVNIITDHRSEQSELQVTGNVEHDLSILKKVYHDCCDIVFRTFETRNNQKAALIYIEGLSNKEEINENVMKVIEEMAIPIGKSIISKIPVSEIKEVQNIYDCMSSLAKGNPILLLEELPFALSLGLAKYEMRSIEEPVGESTIRGPREGFTEVISVNLALLRRKIRSTSLKMKAMEIGEITKTTVVIAYMEGIVDPDLISEVESRLQKICIDGILESNYIEELIEDNPLSPFPQLLSTERPDTVTAGLLEGRAAILVDGTPFCLIAPISIFSLLQSAEDYYNNYMISTLVRWLRYMFFGISFLLPSVYIALVTFHQEMLPTSLLISMATSREMVPFPAILEAFVMEITFEALREAGVRLPKQIGSAVSIVGALVIGQAAVQAGIVSTPMVIVVSITGIASFMTPRYNLGFSIRVIRFPIMILAGTLGILGVMLGICWVIVHLASLRSFGVPYLTVSAPYNREKLKDELIRAPWWVMNTRPQLFGNKNLTRQGSFQKPGPNRKTTK